MKAPTQPFKAIKRSLEVIIESYNCLLDLRKGIFITLIWVALGHMLYSILKQWLHFMWPH